VRRAARYGLRATDCALRTARYGLRATDWMTARRPEPLLRPA